MHDSTSVCGVITFVAQPDPDGGGLLLLGLVLDEFNQTSPAACDGCLGA